jgi:transposase InsO family protein
VRYRFIDAHRTEHAVVTMCRVLGVSKAGYYSWRDRAPSERELSNRRLAAEIRTVHQRSRQTYGSPRVHAELVASGEKVNRKRVERVMRVEGIRAKKKRRFRVTTDSRHGEPVAPNVLNRQFSVDEVAGRDRVWASDITYVPTLEGWLYLAVVLDLGTRSVVGWAMRHTLERRLACDALEMALERRSPDAGVLHHSDRGSQYASGDFRALLEREGMIASMSRKGDCWDNAVVESFFSTLKSELVEDAKWATREEARLALFEWIEVWYNRQRRHSSLGYMSPMQYEQEMQMQAAA